nr:NADH-quinone oxidoreductase subunit C [Streptomyces scabichelini]
MPAPVEELFGTEATAEESYEVLTVDVPPTAWISALETARGELGCTYFDWLSAVDEPGTGFRVSAHVVALAPVRRLLVRTTVPHDAPVLPSAVDVYAGAAWHERETHEMFGVTFEGHPGLAPLLLPDGFEGHPLRKDFVLAARVVKAWPGAKEPGESEHGGPKRRQMLPPGVPDPNEWGPLKGQLPPAPARPARGAGRAAGERPARRARTAGEGSASQAPAAEGTSAAGTGAAGTGAAGAAGEGRTAAPRRAHSAGEGSATQRAEGAEPGTASGPASGGAPASGAETPPASPRRARTAGEGSASQREAPAAPADEPGGEQPSGGRPGSEQPGGAQEGGERPGRPARPRSTDAPWHHARPAFEDTERKPPTEEPLSPEEPQPADVPPKAPEPSEAAEAGPTDDNAPATDDSPAADDNPPGGPQ